VILKRYKLTIIVTRRVAIKRSIVAERKKALALVKIKIRKGARRVKIMAIALTVKRKRHYRLSIIRTRPARRDTFSLYKGRILVLSSPL